MQNLLKTFFIAAVSFLLLTTPAAGETQLSSLEELQKENTALRSEIIRINAELTLMKQWLAGMVSAEKELSKTDAAEIRLANLTALQQNGMTLALKADAVSKQIRQELRSGKFDEATRIKYRMLLDELDEAARSFSSKAASGDLKKQELQIIAVDRKLQMAVLSGGSSAGIAPGMILFPQNSTKSELQLRVISVRPGACAADLHKGSWGEVIPGMLLTPFQNKR